MAHPIVGFEIAGTDAAALGAFYGGLFGWSIAPAGAGALTVDTNGGTGLTGRVVTAPVPGAAVFIGVPDLRASLDAVAAAGGSVAHGPGDVPRAGASARFADPAGTVTGLVSPAPAARPGPGAGAPVTYVEIFGPGLFGPGGLLAFYTDVFGWTPLHGQTGGVPYVQVDPGRGGDVVAAVGDTGQGTSRVILYAAVPELDPWCEKASRLGGTVAVPPSRVGDEVEFAHLTDPQGTTVGVWRTLAG